MSICARMRNWGFVVFVAAAVGCSDKMPPPFRAEDRTPRSDKDAPFDPPRTYPAWAYDSPSYMRPAGELIPAPRAKNGDPLHYFTNDKLVMIRQPDGYTPEDLPRVAVWWTDNNGFHWHKAGYFGRGQAYFPFEVEEDGDYGIRFIGPGQAPEVHALAYPERVYHVDTMLPEVEVAVEPQQSWYQPGQVVTVSWRVDDYHLVEAPVNLVLLMDFAAAEPRAVELQRELANEGAVTVTIPPEATDHEIRFRVEARDRAGNLGLTFSHALQVVETKTADANQATQAKPDTTEDVKEPPPSDEAEQQVHEDGADREDGALDVDTLTAMADGMEVPEAANSAGPAEDAPLGSLDEDQRQESAMESARTAKPAGDLEATRAGDKTLPYDDAEAADSKERIAAAAWDGSSDYPTRNEAEATADMTSDAAGAESVDLAEGGPAVVPFSHQSARDPSSGHNLQWQGPHSGPFPSGNPTETKRSVTGFLGDNDRASAEVSQDQPSEQQGREPETADVAAESGKADDVEPDDAGGAESDGGAVSANPSNVDAIAAVAAGTLGEQAEPPPAGDSAVDSVDGHDAAVDLVDEYDPAVEPAEAAPVRHVVSVVDLTHGNGLLIPLPATIEDRPAQARYATIHPWRILGEVLSSPVQTVWMLPRPSFGVELDRAWGGRFLADHPALRAVGEPGGVTRALAGLPEDASEPASTFRP